MRVMRFQKSQQHYIRADKSGFCQIWAHYTGLSQLRIQCSSSSDNTQWQLSITATWYPVHIHR